MPFLTYDANQQRVLFLTQANEDFEHKKTSPVWKLYVSINDEEPKRIETGLPEQNVECSPTAWQDEAGWHLSFIGQDAKDVYRLYRMDGETLQQLSQPISIRRARTGFIYKDRLAVGEIQDVVHIHDNNGDHNIEIPGTFLYRVSYRADDPNKILISGDWIHEDEEPFTIEYDLELDTQRYIEIETDTGESSGAYKPTIYGDEILFAERTGKLFEHRKVKNKKKYHGVCCNMAHRKEEAMNQAALQITKKCGCRKSEKEAVQEGITRSSCLDCVEKHLGAAMVLSTEIEQGYEYRLLFIGHLNEAEEESQEYPKLSKTIHNSRKAYQKDGIIPNWSEISAQLKDIKQL
jgi:hypothetical protein